MQRKKGDGTGLDEQRPSAQKVADAKATENDLDLGDAAAGGSRGKDAHEIGGERSHADGK